MNLFGNRLRLACAIYFLCLVGAVLHAYPGIFKNFSADTAVKKSVLSKKPVFTYPVTAQVSAQSAVLPEITSVYRGDIHRTGSNSGTLSTHLKKSWTYRTLNIGIHSASKASPAIDASGVYVGSDQSWFYAFDHQGKLKWKFYVSGAKFGVHGTASLDQSRVYFGSYGGSLYCLDKNTGALIWVTRLGDALGASPVLFGDSVYVGVELNKRPDGFVSRIRRSDGKLLWRSPLMGDQDHCSPTIDEVHGLVIGGANTGKIYAYELDTGNLKWTLSLKGAVKSTSPLIDNVLYVTSWGKNFTAVDVQTGGIIWQTGLKWGSRSSPTLVPKLNYFIVTDEKGGIYAVSKSDGKIVWEIDSAMKRLISSALVIRNERGKYLAWLPCQPGMLCALDPANGKVVATYPLETDLTSVPIVWDQNLYLALDKAGGLVKMEKAVYP